MAHISKFIKTASEHYPDVVLAVHERIQNPTVVVPPVASPDIVKSIFEGLFFLQETMKQEIGRLRTVAWMRFYADKFLIAYLQTNDVISYPDDVNATVKLPEMKGYDTQITAAKKLFLDLIKKFEALAKITVEDTTIPLPALLLMREMLFALMGDIADRAQANDIAQANTLREKMSGALTHLNKIVIEKFFIQVNTDNQSQSGVIYDSERVSQYIKYSAFCKESELHIPDEKQPDIIKRKIKQIETLEAIGFHAAARREEKSILDHPWLKSTTFWFFKNTFIQFPFATAMQSKYELLKTSVLDDIRGLEDTTALDDMVQSVVGLSGDVLEFRILVNEAIVEKKLIIKKTELEQDYQSKTAAAVAALAAKNALEGKLVAKRLELTAAQAEEQKLAEKLVPTEGTPEEKSEAGSPPQPDTLEKLSAEEKAFIEQIKNKNFVPDTDGASINEEAALQAFITACKDQTGSGSAVWWRELLLTEMYLAHACHNDVTMSAAPSVDSLVAPKPSTGGEKSPVSASNTPSITRTRSVFSSASKQTKEKPVENRRQKAITLLERCIKANTTTNKEEKVKEARLCLTEAIAAVQAKFDALKPALESAKAKAETSARVQTLTGEVKELQTQVETSATAVLAAEQAQKTALNACKQQSKTIDEHVNTARIRKETARIRKETVVLKAKLASFAGNDDRDKNSVLARYLDDYKSRSFKYRFFACCSEAPARVAFVEKLAGEVRQLAATGAQGELDLAVVRTKLQSLKTEIDAANGGNVSGQDNGQNNVPNSFKLFAPRKAKSNGGDNEEYQRSLRGVVEAEVDSMLRIITTTP